MKVSTKLYVGILLQFIVAITSVLLVLNMQNKQASDSVIINLAGRQRMLSQKISKEILLFSTDAISAENVKATINIFDSTLKGLTYGGEVPLDLKQTEFKVLPEPASIESIEQLNKVGVLWQPFHENALKVLDEKNETSLNYIRENNVTLLKEMNKAVFLMDKDASSKVNAVKNLLIGGGIGLALLFFITIFIVRKNVQVMLNLLHNLSTGLSKASKKTWKVSSEVNNSSLQLAEGASEQAATLEETSSSLEEMSSMVKQNADNSILADDMTKQSSEIIHRADNSMSKLSVSMKEITRASEETSNIIKTIDEIAFQTNLLALNAAVEAARAGEAGAGFAVVADEVRNLAMRAATAAQNTSELIEEIVQRIHEGSESANTINLEFKEIMASSDKVNNLIGEITSASKEQSQGIEQVNIAVSEIDKVVQLNAVNAENSSTASEEMKVQAEQMKFMVEQLVGIVEGSKSKKASSAN